MADEELELEAGEDGPGQSSIAKLDSGALHGIHKKKKMTRAERIAHQKSMGEVSCMRPIAYAFSAD